MQLNTPDNDEDMNCKTDFSFVLMFCTLVVCVPRICVLRLCWPNKESKKNRIKPIGLYTAWQMYIAMSSRRFAF